MTTLLPGGARAVLDSPALAHLVTLNPDGSSQVTVVSAGLDGDEIVGPGATTWPAHDVPKQMRHDLRARHRGTAASTSAR
jgi:hypothetical protein